MPPIWIVDAFTDVRFRGNPAAVCLLEGPAADAWRQDVAAEMNLSETAFLEQQEDGWTLRWFTPALEVDLCGHATLASAFVLWETGRLGREESACFHTRSGLLTAQRAGDRIILDLPALPATPAALPPGLAEALRCRPVASAQVGQDWVVEVATEHDVRGLAPDFGALVRLPVGFVMATAAASRKPHDFVSRFFAPAFGINEDPVTGVAHCTLGPYWAARFGRSELLAWQASPRGGEVQVTVAGDRVRLGGRAVLVLEGRLVP